jgi:predicted transposase YbfD/YdcC
VDKAHGRLERRRLRVTTILTLHQRWPGLQQGFEVTRERTEKGKTTVEVVYGITSLRPEEADADRLLGLVREHWRIENCLHWVRDMTLGEDACRVRSGSAPQVLAALRNVVVHLLSGEASKSETGESRAAVCNRLAARPTEALEVLGIAPLE